MGFLKGAFGCLAKPVPNDGMLEMQAGKAIFDELHHEKPDAQEVNEVDEK